MISVEQRERLIKAAFVGEWGVRGLCYRDRAAFWGLYCGGGAMGWVRVMCASS